MRTLTYALMLAVLGTLVAACNSGESNEIKDDSAVLATFEGGQLTQAEVEAFLASMNERQRTRFKTPEGRKDMIERLALNKALAADATAQGIGQTARDQIAMRQAEENYLVNRLMKDLRESAAGEEAARAYYDEHIEDYKKEQVQARHILLKDEGAAKEARKRADADEDFEALCKELSEDRASKIKGGDLGWFGRGRMTPEFEEAVFALQTGEITGPIKTRFGYHVIKKEGERTEIPFEEVVKRINRKLERESITTYMDEKKEVLAVTIDENVASTIDVDTL